MTARTTDQNPTPKGPRTMTVNATDPEFVEAIVAACDRLGIKATPERRGDSTVLRVVGVALVAVLATLVPAVSASASGDTRPCVTRAEFRTIHRGDTARRVFKILDGPGRVDSSTEIDGERWESHNYAPCTTPRLRNVWIDFHAAEGARLTVTGKTAYW